MCSCLRVQLTARRETDPSNPHARFVLQNNACLRGSFPGVCEINAHPVRSIAEYLGPRTPEFNVALFAKCVLRRRDGRLFRSARNLPWALRQH